MPPKRSWYAPKQPPVAPTRGPRCAGRGPRCAGRGRRTHPMPDPFEALRTAPTPIDPDPAFASRLRARVIRALHPDQGDQTMVMQTTETTNRLRQGDMSYVSAWVQDVERAARFYSTVLGWGYGPGQVGGPFREVQNQSISQGITELRASGEFLRQLGMPLTRELSPTAYVVFVVDDLDAGIERVRAAGGWAG